MRPEHRHSRLCGAEGLARQNAREMGHVVSFSRSRWEWAGPDLALDLAPWSQGQFQGHGPTHFKKELWPRWPNGYPGPTQNSSSKILASGFLSGCMHVDSKRHFLLSTVSIPCIICTNQSIYKTHAPSIYIANETMPR
jgi:hypothetical protein